MQTLHTEEYHGYTIDIVPDDCDESPREWDNLGTMACFHRNYTLGDKHDLTVDDLKAIVQRDDVLALPLFLYDHSGISMSTGRAYPFDCPWDSGQVGYIYITHENVLKEYGKPLAQSLKKAEKYLQGEVTTYDEYLTGQVYGYVVKDAHGEHVDSCYGFYGSYDDPDHSALSEARTSADHHATEQKKQHEARLKAQIKHHTPLEAR